MSGTYEDKHSMIVTIVKKGKARRICRAAKETGAEGGTTMLGRGTSTKEFQKAFGLSLDEEREVVFTVVKKEIEDRVFEGIIESCEMNKPGTGIAFVMDLKHVAGIAHLLKEVVRDE